MKPAKVHYGTENERKLKRYLSSYLHEQRRLERLNNRYSWLQHHYSKLTSREYESVRDSISVQIETCVKTLDSIIHIISLLPDGSVERTIMECKYIDGLNHVQIEFEINYVNSAICRYLKKGIDTLLTYDEVLAVIGGTSSEETESQE